MGAYYKSKLSVAKSAVSQAKIWLIAIGGLVGVAAAAWGISAGSRADANAVTVPPEFTLEAMKERVAEHQRPDFRKMRETMARDDLSIEQKRQIAENMRDVFRSEMRARVDEYYNASAEDKTAVLDKQIDEFQKMREQFRRRREQDGADSDRPSKEERDKMRQIMRPQSKQDRKSRSESRNADETARTMAYFSAMRSRAKERGIEMGRGPGPGGPGRGGPGGRDGPRGQGGSRGGRPGGGRRGP